MKVEKKKRDKKKRKTRAKNTKEHEKRKEEMKRQKKRRNQSIIEDKISVKLKKKEEISIIATEHKKNLQYIQSGFQFTGEEGR